MKYLFVFLFAHSALANSIDRVVVFADRAEVVRSQTVKCAGGVATATFDNLPASLDVRTLHGASDNAHVIGVSSEKIAVTEDRDERVRELQKHIEAQNDELETLRTFDRESKERRAVLSSYEKYFHTLANEQIRRSHPNLGQFDKMLGLLAAEEGALRGAQRKRDVRRREILRKRQRLQTRLAQFGPRAEAVIRASAAVQCQGPKATVRLGYVVPGATWAPEYDARYKRGGVTLVVSAVIRQSTGEDWRDAEVWLSTAKPAFGGEAPMPGRIVVRGHEGSKDRTLVQAQEQRAPSLKAGEKTQSQGAEFDDGGKSFVLKVKERVSVVSDGRPYWFPVDQKRAKAKMKYVAVPKLSPFVYRTTRFNNPAAYPLMAGRVHVYHGDTFVGDLDLPYVAPGENIELSLGIDEQIRVERKDLLAKKHAAGFFSGAQSITHHYRYILHNRTRGMVHVELRAQLPVSKSKDIKVTIDKKKTSAGYTLDPLRGHLQWQAAIKSGGYYRKELRFTIELPKNWKVN